MKTIHLAIIVISGIISSGIGFASADVEKSTITVNDTQYEIDSSSAHSTINTISTNLHSYVYNSLDMNITSDKKYNGSLTLTLTKDTVANVFCITRSDVDDYLKSGNAFDVAVDDNPENFTTSYTNNETSLTFDIPKGSQNATIFNEFVGMAVSPLVYFKGIPQTGTYSSGQDVTFNGTLVDACGRHLGMEKVYFTAQQLNVTKEVASDTKGKFSIDFTIPENTEHGNYTSKIEMYQYGLAYPLNGVETLYLNVKTNNVHTVPESPLKQFKSGISAKDVKCSDGFTLVIKAEDGTPACVTDSGMGRMVRQGWWAWNDKVGDTIVNTPDKRDFDDKTCGIPEVRSSIVGTNGFVKDDLTPDGITYYGADIQDLVGEVIQFAIHPNSTAQIAFTYDFNPYPGSNCKVTTKDAIANIDPAKPNASLSDLLSSPDIMEINQTMVRNDMPLLGNSGDVMVKLSSTKDLNDHVVKVTYQIVSKPSSEIGKSYFVGFWWHSAVVVTVGNDLYHGTALSGPRFG